MLTSTHFKRTVRTIGTCCAMLVLGMHLSACVTPTSGAGQPGAVLPQNMNTNRLLFFPAAAPADKAQNATRAKEAIRARPVTIDLKLLSSYAGTGDQSGRTLTLNLFDDATFTAQSDSIERTEHGFTWTGRLQGVENSQVIIVANDGAVSGNITMPDARYHIRFLGGGVHEVQRIDTTRFKND